MKKGFTLIETIIVITLLAMIASLSVATHRNSTKKARETVLLHNLANVRMTLDHYNNDKGRYPDSLETLKDEGYLREIPLDPMTKSRDTWQLVYEQDTGDEDSSYEPGLFDIHSGSDEVAIDGTYYYEW